MAMVLTRETFVAGTTDARKRLSRLVEAASKGTPVTIVAGDRIVTMVARDAWVSLLERVQAAEETAALLADPEAMRRLRQSRRDIKAGRGVGVAEAARLLNAEE
jgi:PHD/YefM family antitoxin component YafN of YafNO toxin-antitoxin module